MQGFITFYPMWEVETDPKISRLSFIPQTWSHVMTEAQPHTPWGFTALGGVCG